MKIRKAIAAALLSLTILGGTVACDSAVNDNSGDVLEYEYGYYNPYGGFVYYSTPRVVYVSTSYYTTHSRLFANPYHHSLPRGYARPGTTRTTTTTRTTRTTTTRTTRSTLNISRSRPGNLGSFGGGRKR